MLNLFLPPIGPTTEICIQLHAHKQCILARFKREGSTFLPPLSDSVQAPAKVSTVSALVGALNVKRQCIGNSSDTEHRQGQAKAISISQKKGNCSLFSGGNPGCATTFYSLPVDRPHCALGATTKSRNPLLCLHEENAFFI